MTYIALVLALALGYIIGILQKGILIYTGETVQTEKVEYNKSVGKAEFMEYYDDTEGVNKF